jgi:prepilin-type N-terminal cleavage/methylation domain-containing protein
MNTTTKSRKGFTLIELVVTIVLLGALAAIASVSYSAFLSDARGEIAAIEAVQGDRIAAAQALLDEEGEYQAPAAPTWGVLTGTSTGIGPGLSSDNPLSFVLDWPNGTMTATLYDMKSGGSWTFLNGVGIVGKLWVYDSTSLSYLGQISSNSFVNNGDGTVTMTWDITGASFPISDPTTVLFEITDGYNSAGQLHSFS